MIFNEILFCSILRIALICNVSSHGKVGSLFFFFKPHNRVEHKHISIA